MTERHEADLWKILQDNHLVAGEAPNNAKDNSPWYVRTMLGIAGWVGALFLLGALFSGFAMLFDSTLASAVLGAASCLIAIVIYRAYRSSDFLAQFGFAISLAGQGLLIFSMLQGLQFFDGGDGYISQIRIMAIMLALLQLILFLMIPNYLHRIWSAVIGIGAVTFLMIQLGLYPFTLVVLLGAAAWLWLQEFTLAKYASMLQALGYSLVFVCFAHLVTESRFLGMGHFWQEAFGVVPLGGRWSYDIAALLLGVVLVAVVWVLLRRNGRSPTSGLGIAGLSLAIVIAMIGVRAPGVTIALVFMILGYAHGNRVLTGIGIVTMIVFISQFYYQLNFTLLQKSIVLVVSGMTLLIARKMMHRLWPKQEQHHA